MGVQQDCIYHLGIEEKVIALEKQLKELKELIKDYPTKSEIDIIITKIERDIEELKVKNEQQDKNNLNLQQAVTRLEEMNNYLRDMLEIYNQQAKSLSDKMDKINDTLSEKIEKIYTLILTKTSGEGKLNYFKDFFMNNKMLLMVIVLLVSLVIYLLTGRWVLDEKILGNN